MCHIKPTYHFFGWVGVILLSFFVLSCEKGATLEEGDIRSYQVVLDAGLGKVGTKVSLEADNSMAWDNSDKLSFITVSADGYWASTALEILSLSNDGASAKFGGSVDMSQEPQMCYFAYPNVDGALTCSGTTVSATFEYDAQTGRHDPFLYGEREYSVSDMNVSLHHIGGMLRIKLPDASTIKKITVMGNSNEPLTPYTYSMEKGSAVGSGSGSIAQGAAISFDVELSASSLEQINGEYYCYIAMPPVKFAKGFSLIFSDGNRNMYRSFNYTTEGGCDFSKFYQSSSPATLRGAIVDIDASDFKGYSINASLAAEHVFENNTLTGTRVKLVGAAMQGFPASVVTEWGVELCNGSGEVVRSISYENLSGGTGYTKPGDINSASSAVMTNQNDWPYLPKGAYTVKPYVKTIYGDAKQYGSSSRFDVPALDASKLTPTVSAVTSYTYYKAGDRTNANRAGTGSSIHNITAGVNISDAILANPKYAVNATVVDKSTNGTLSVSRELGTASQVLLDRHNVTEWKAYTLASYIEFDGVKTSEATTTVHVTGLPYVVTFDNGTANGWNIYHTDYASNGTLRLSANKTDSSRGYVVSPKYHIPEDVKISYLVKAYYYCSLVGAGSCTIWIEPTSGPGTKSQSSTGHYKNNPNISLPATYDGDSNTGSSTLTSGKPYMNISHNCTTGTWQTRYICVRGVVFEYEF